MSMNLFEIGDPIEVCQCMSTLPNPEHLTSLTRQRRDKTSIKIMLAITLDTINHTKCAKQEIPKNSKFL